MGRSGLSGFRSWRSSQSRPRHGDASMGSVLSDRRFLHYFRPKHLCRAVSFRACRVDVDLVRLFFSLANDRKPIDGIVRGCAACPVGSILTLRQTMSLLRAQHVSSRLAVLGFFQNEIQSPLRALRFGRCSFISRPSVWNCACSRARQLEFVLPTLRPSAALALVCRACHRCADLTMACHLLSLLEWISPEYNISAVPRRVC